MKRGFILIFLSLLMISLFVSAEDTSLSTGISAEEAEKIQQKIDQLPIDDSGKIDTEKFTPYKSKAEERIDSIELWLNTNAGWLKIFFGMVPEVSWLFLIDFLVIITMIVYFRNILVFFSSFSEGIATTIALALVFISIQVQVTVTSAQWIADKMSKWWIRAALISIIVISIAVGFWLQRYLNKLKVAKAGATLVQNAKISTRREEIMSKIDEELGEDN